MKRLGKNAKPISLSEWESAAKRNPNFVITGQLRQENPFTQETIVMNMPGSGYWNPEIKDHTGWPHDGLVWFRYSGSDIFFIQYSNVANPELQEIATELNAGVEAED